MRECDWGKSQLLCVIIEELIRLQIVCKEKGTNAGDDQRHGVANVDNENLLFSRPNSTNDGVSQSVPADYTQWQVHSLLPEREYTCHVQAFDQYGRNGPLHANSVAIARTAEKAPERAPEISFVLVKEAVRFGHFKQYLVFRRLALVMQCCWIGGQCRSAEIILRISMAFLPWEEPINGDIK